MNWETAYSPPDANCWHGHEGIPAESCFFQLAQGINLRDEIPKRSTNIAFALLGFKCDEGARRDHGRTGAAEGPAAIRQKLATLPIQKTNITCFDVGDITCNNQDLEQSQAALKDVIALLLEKNLRPIVLGGGHELAWGHYLGIAEAYSQENKLGIINFDAHFDLNPANAGLGGANSSFYQIALEQQKNHRHFDYNCIGIQHAGNIRKQFAIAKKLKTKLILADEMHQGLQEKCFDFVDRVIDENEAIYMSISLDVFSPAFAPGVSSVQPLGLNPWHIIPLIRQVAASGKAVSYDIAEYVPRYDIDHRTAKLAATLIYEIIHHHNEHPRTW